MLGCFSPKVTLSLKFLFKMDTPIATTPEANRPVEWKAHEKLRNKNAIAVMQAAI